MIFAPDNDQKFLQREYFAYLFNHIAQHNGYFGTPHLDRSEFVLTAVDSERPEIKKNPDGPDVISLPRKKLNTVFSWLLCQDSLSPDEEPEAISSPHLDRLLNEWHQQIMDYCRQNRRSFLYKMHWPHGKPLAVSITHDIDLTRKYGMKSLLAAGLTFQTKKLGQYYHDSVFKENIYWNFDDILKYYGRNDFRSTFFFIARSWEGKQFRYNINQKKFRKLFQKISDGGHEIGLHTSRYAFDFPDRITREKRKLEKHINKSVHGVRQHYLRLKFPEGWMNFESEGFLYDSTCGYNNAPGFRAATSFPFRTYSIKNNSPNRLWEVPFSIMDYSWFYHVADESRIKPVFQAIVEKIESVEGLVHVLWHPSNLAEKTFQPLWKYLTGWLEGKNFYNGSLSEIVGWRKIRAGVNCVQLKETDEFLEFILTTDQPVRDLSLGIMSARPFTCDESIEPKDDGLFQFNVPDLKPGQHLFRLRYES